MGGYYVPVCVACLLSQLAASFFHQTNRRPHVECLSFPRNHQRDAVPRACESPNLGLGL